MIERTNIYKGEFSPTGIETAFCYRKFYYSKILGLETKRPPLALFFGSAIHKAVETFYIEKYRATLSPTELNNLVVKTFIDEWNSYQIEGDDKRNLASGIAIIGNYCEYYKDDTAQIIEQFIEAKQWVPMPNGTHLLCKIDRVRQDGTRLTVVDTKTSSWPLTDYYFKGYQNNLQTSLYYYAVQQILGECHQIQIDGIKVPPPKPGSATLSFARRTFLRQDLQIEDTLNTYCRMTDYMMGNLDKYKDDEEALVKSFYCNQSKCDEYGGCDFLPICTYGFNHPTVQVAFDRREITKQERPMDNKQEYINQILKAINKQLADSQLYMADADIKTYIEEGIKLIEKVRSPLDEYIKYFNEGSVLSKIANIEGLSVFTFSNLLQNLLNVGDNTIGAVMQIVSLKVMLNASPKIITADKKIVE